MSNTTGDFVFVSYAREDQDRLESELFKPIRNHAIPYWYDEHIGWSASWWRDDVRPHLKNAHAVVVVMTPAAAASQWVLREVTVAIEDRKPVFTVLLEGEPLAELEDHQRVDLTEGREIPDDWFDELQACVRRGRFARLAKKTGRGALVAVGVVSGLIGIFSFVVPLLRTEVDPLPTFAADYGIGVSEFPVDGGSTVRENVAAEVESFQPRLVEGIRATLAAQNAAASADVAAPSTEVQPLPRTVGGETVDEVDVNARSLLEKSGADVLVFGHIEIDGASLIARPTMYLDRGSLPRAEELAGRFELTAIDQDISETSGALLLRGAIAALGTDLGRLAQVVRLYDSGEFAEAVEYIEELKSAGSFAAPGVLFIFEGNLLGKLERPTEAVEAYEQALDDPRVADRARLGLAQVAYAELLGSDGWCGPSTDVDAMADVIDDYEALAARPSVPGANIDTKGRFGAGRARICLESAGLSEEPGRGRRDLELVIAEYDAQGDSERDGDLRELAAEAEGLMGFAGIKSASDDAEANAVLAHLDRAISLTIFSERRIAFRLAKADAFIAFGEGDAACREVDEIERLTTPDRPVDELRVKYSCE